MRERLVIATRMPPAPTGHPFKGNGDIVAECAVEGCGYGAMGPREDVKKAMNDHRLMYHSQEISLIHLNWAKQ